MQSTISKISALLLASLVVACHSDSNNNNVQNGLNTIMVDGIEREYFLQLPTNYNDSNDGMAAPATVAGESWPIVLAYHGYSGSLENWLGDTPFYDLAEVIGDGAIIVAPNGLADTNGLRSWGAANDFLFFEALLDDLDAGGIRYDANRIFLAGHSNGAGHANELACRFGDTIRAIAVAAGSLIRTECIGSVATLLMQGSNDPLTSGVLARNTLKYWVLYNGWDEAASTVSTLGPCDDYSFPGEENTPYPVLYCEHEQGHDWPDFGSQTAWDLFTSLPIVTPTADFPAGGGAERATPPTDTTLTFRMDVPADINRPLNAAATLRPPEFLENPTCSAPDIVLNLRFSVDGLLVAGQVSEPITIPITYFGGAFEIPSDWTLGITVYVEGGNDGTIPSPFVDHEISVPFTLVDRSTPVVFDEPLVLRPVGDLCGLLD